jgi:CrcB protein
MFETTLWVAIGGAVGSVARYWVALWMLPLSRDLPWGTMLINVVGSFVISFFGTLTVEHGRYASPELWRIAVMVGICGGFTADSDLIRPPIPRVIRPPFRSLSGQRSDHYPATSFS